MSLELKPGVRIQGLRPETVLALQIIEGAFRDAGIPMTTITSGIESSHSRASFHYSGAAVDIRTRNVETAKLAPLRAEIARRLADDFDVVLEGDHLHIEYEPKKPLSGV